MPGVASRPPRLETLTLVPVLPHMRERRTGTIVNVSSLGGRLATPSMGVYNGSKFAMEGMTDALRPEVSEYGIDAVLVEPGPVDTAERAVSMELDASTRTSRCGIDSRKPNRFRTIPV